MEAVDAVALAMAVSVTTPVAVARSTTEPFMRLSELANLVEAVLARCAQQVHHNPSCVQCAVALAVDMVVPVASVASVVPGVAALLELSVPRCLSVVA